MPTNLATLIQEGNLLRLEKLMGSNTYLLIIRVNDAQHVRLYDGLSDALGDYRSYSDPEAASLAFNEFLSYYKRSFLRLLHKGIPAVDIARLAVQEINL